MIKSFFQMKIKNFFDNSSIFSHMLMKKLTVAKELAKIFSNL